MEISIDDRGAVYVLRTSRLPYQVLLPDGTVEETFVDRASMAIYEDADGRPEHVRSADYDEGYRDGWDEAVEVARDALSDVGPPPRRRPAPRVVTPALAGGLL